MSKVCYNMCVFGVSSDFYMIHLQLLTVFKQLFVVANFYLWAVFLIYET
jgi:hypothetical protein